MQKLRYLKHYNGNSRILDIEGSLKMYISYVLCKGICILLGYSMTDLNIGINFLKL